jgi:ElaB/YqjD/DUF883 family membrane-anchored ribosome-binding protein
MAEAYRPTRSAEALQERPHDLSDPAGIARELAGEAVEDTKEAVGRMTAYTQVLAKSPGMVGDFMRFTRAKPLEAFAVVAGIAFLAGAFLKMPQLRSSKTHRGD